MNIAINITMCIAPWLGNYWIQNTLQGLWFKGSPQVWGTEMIKRKQGWREACFKTAFPKRPWNIRKIGLRKFQTVPFSFIWRALGDAWNRAGGDKAPPPHIVLTLCHPQATPPSWHCLGLLRSNHRTRHLSEQLEVKSTPVKPSPEAFAPGFPYSADLCDLTLLYWPAATQLISRQALQTYQGDSFTVCNLWKRRSLKEGLLLKGVRKEPSQESLWSWQCCYGLCFTFFLWLRIHPHMPSLSSKSQTQTHTGIVCKTPVFSDWVHLNGAATSVFTNGISINISISVRSGHLKISHQDLHCLF